MGQKVSAYNASKKLEHQATIFLDYKDVRESGQMGAVWPDVGIKSCQIFYKIAQFVHTGHGSNKSGASYARKNNLSIKVLLHLQTVGKRELVQIFQINSKRPRC